MNTSFSFYQSVVPCRNWLARTGAVLAWAFAAGHLGCSAALGQTNQVEGPKPIPLGALVTEALARNPELRFYESEIAAARAGMRTAAAWPNPELSAAVGHKTARMGGLQDEGLAWSVALVQPFEWPGRIGLRKAIANHDLDLARLGEDRFKAALANRVRLLGFRLFSAQERAAAAGEVAERFRALREVLVQRDPAGLTPLLETRVIEATELNAQRNASQARLDMESALLELNQLRGVDPTTELRVAEPDLDFPAAPERDRLLSAARTNNFELRIRAAELMQQGVRLELARNERYPVVSLGPTFSEEEVAGERERIAGVTVSLPIPLWNRNRGGVESAVAREAQAGVAYDVALRDVVRSVLTAAAAYETKRLEISRWRPDSIRHFREAAEIADRHYRLGAVPISTYVELQKQYLEAVQSLLDTREETLAAAAEIELLTGLTLLAAPAGSSSGGAR